MRVCARYSLYLSHDLHVLIPKSLMLLHRRVVRELKRLLPAEAYYRAGSGNAMFCLPYKQRVFVKRVGLRTIEVRTKLMLTRGHPVYGVQYDCGIFRTAGRRVWIARDLRVLLASYIQESSASSPGGKFCY